MTSTGDSATHGDDEKMADSEILETSEPGQTVIHTTSPPPPPPPPGPVFNVPISAMGQVSYLQSFNNEPRGTGFPVFPEIAGNWSSCISSNNDKSEVLGTSLLHHTNLNSLIKKLVSRI
jgi:hypothetical protein